MLPLKSGLKCGAQNTSGAEWDFFQPSFSLSIYLKRKETGFWLSVNNSFRHLWGRNKTRGENLMAVNLCVTEGESDGKKKKKKI